MSEAKFTPGPWKVLDTQTPCIKEVYGPSFRISCVMWANDLSEADFAKRNADLALIAAAPELLEALEELLAMCERQTDFNDDGDGNTLSRSKAAIAKARGEA